MSERPATSSTVATSMQAAEIRRVVQEELQLRGVSVYSRTQQLIRRAASDVGQAMHQLQPTSADAPLLPSQQENRGKRKAQPGHPFR